MGRTLQKGTIPYGERDTPEQDRNTPGGDGGNKKVPHHSTPPGTRRVCALISPRDRQQETLSEEEKRSVSRLSDQFRAGLLSDLQAYPNWVLWKREQERKVPYHPSGRYRASSPTPHTWGTLQEALSTLSQGGFAGLGFMLDPRKLPLTFIDFDHCLSREFPAESLMDICDPHVFDRVCALRSYTELSPSGGGLHVLALGKLPSNMKKQGIEMYDHARYLTVTGHHIAGTPRTIEHRQEQIMRLFDAYSPPVREEQRNPPVPGREVKHHVVELPWLAAFDPLLQELLRGETARYGGDASRADFVLLMKLLYWTGDNIELTKRLFLASPLGQREKDGRRKATDKRGSGTYVDMTIQKILRTRTPLQPCHEPA